MRLTVDMVCIRGSKILLIRRGIEPYKGMWALPGGHVDEDETVEEAAMRELKEETGLDARGLTLVGVYSDPDRDPRGRTVTIGYRVEVDAGDPSAATDAVEARFWPLDDLPELAFDHADIIADGTGQ